MCTSTRARNSSGSAVSVPAVRPSASSNSSSRTNNRSTARRNASVNRVVSWAGHETKVPSGRKPPSVTRRCRCGCQLAREPCVCSVTGRLGGREIDRDRRGLGIGRHRGGATQLEHPPSFLSQLDDGPIVGRRLRFGQVADCFPERDVVAGIELRTTRHDADRPGAILCGLAPSRFAPPCD